MDSPTWEDPDALNALGRLVGKRGEAALAIGLQRFALRLAPEHASAAVDLATATAAIVSAADAERAYAAALALEPDIACHHRCVGATERFVGMERVEELLRSAIALDPSHARAHAALGNVLARWGDREGAMAAYALATLLDWEDAAAHLALAQLYDTADHHRDAARHLGEALARRVHYRAAASSAVRRVLALKVPGGFLANALLDFFIDPNRTDLDVFYVTDDATALPDLADVDVIFSAIGATERHADTIERAAALLARAGKPVLNHPAFVQRVQRAVLGETLRDVPGCVVPPTVRLARASLASGDVALPFPLIVRPVDTHRGDGMERVATPSELLAASERLAADAYHATRFVDYRSADGYYRKCRVIVVGGVPYPYHLAISDEWLVHYWRVSDVMRANPSMRAEEEAFLAQPESVFPTWTATFSAMAEAIGLDFFGVDCARLDDGRVLVFECDPCAFVHTRDADDDAFAYKYRYVPRIFAALDELITARAGR